MWGGGGEEVKQIFVDIQIEIIKYNSASKYTNSVWKQQL